MRYAWTIVYKTSKSDNLAQHFEKCNFTIAEDCDIIADTNIENLHLYYDLTAVSILANTHWTNLLLHIPLKSANRHFTLFKVIILPSLVFSDKFAKYIVDYSFLDYKSVNVLT